MTPAETAEPITPATFGPMACMSRKLPGSSFWPTTCDTLAAIGTAETPAEPIKGLMLTSMSLFMSLARRTPDAVPMANAATPRVRIAKVSIFKNCSAVAVAPTVTPKKIVIMLMSAFLAVSSSI